MRLMWAVLAIVATSSKVLAGDGEPLAPAQLPPELVERVREGFRAEPLHARKIVEGDRACYLVAARDSRGEFELYVSPNGALVRKTEEFTLTRWPAMLAGGALLLMLPGLLTGSVVRWFARAGCNGPLSVLFELLSAWAGAAAGAGLVVFSITTSRYNDGLVLTAFCVVWGAIAASVIEVIALGLAGKVHGASRRRWVAVCGVLAVAALLLTIPLDMLRIERENSHSMKMTLRPVPT
jgi:hypothetical protein